LPAEATPAGASAAVAGFFEVKSRDGARHLLTLERDATVAPGAAPSNVHLVGEVKGATLVVVDTYPSLSGGLAYCQAGEERFLRVISLAPAGPEETLRVKLASCRQNIELTDPGVEWLESSSTLRVHWLLGPSTRAQPEELTLRIGAR